MCSQPARQEGCLSHLQGEQNEQCKKRLRAKNGGVAQDLSLDFILKEVWGVLQELGGH